MMDLGRFSIYVLDAGVDYTGLVRWSWILVGSEGKTTRIVVAHQPCVPNKESKRTTIFEQLQHYFKARRDGRLTHTILHEQLAVQL